MPTIVIGGHTRNIGKTSVVAGLIAALPQLNFTAIKITQFGHNVCSANGEPCDCQTADHSLAISEERDPTTGTDTSRFLAAGAKRVFWVRTRQGELAEAMPRVRKLIAESENTILESNSVLRFLQPDLSLAVLDPTDPGLQTLRPPLPRPRRRPHRPRRHDPQFPDDRTLARRLPKPPRHQTPLPHLSTHLHQPRPHPLRRHKPAQQGTRSSELIARS